MPNKAPGTIFIADDDQALLRLMRTALEREGFVTAAAQSGYEAIAWLLKNSADLLLLDLKLRDLDGAQIIDQLSAVERKLPFIVITGQGDARAAVGMMKRGALDYLLKDTHFLDFLPIAVRNGLARIEREQRLAAAERTVYQNQERFRQTLDNMLEGCQTIGFDWRYLYVNRAAAAHGRRTIDQLLGRTIMEVYPGFEKTPVFARLRECMNQRTGSQFEIQFDFPDGDSGWFQLSVQPVPEGLFILSLDITKRKEEELRRKQLEREILEVSHNEQIRFGRDLHDGLGQQLTALELFSVSLASEIEPHLPKVAKSVRQMSEQLREAIKQTRAMANGLSPVALNEGGLGSALQKLADGTRALTRVDCKFLCPASVELDPGTDAHLYRIAQETTNNALKHGRATKIRISLTRGEDGLVQLAVSDNGRGFSVQQMRSNGMGLRAMKYRAELIGGDLQVESEPGKGTCVTCTVRKTA